MQQRGHRAHDGAFRNGKHILVGRARFVSVSRFPTRPKVRGLLPRLPLARLAHPTSGRVCLEACQPIGGQSYTVRMARLTTLVISANRTGLESAENARARRASAAKRRSMSDAVAIMTGAMAPDEGEATLPN